MLLCRRYRITSPALHHVYICISNGTLSKTPLNDMLCKPAEIVLNIARISRLMDEDVTLEDYGAMVLIHHHEEPTN